MKKRRFRPILAGFTCVRRGMTGLQVRREAGQALPRLAACGIGGTKALEILPLYEANSEKGLESGPGVSYLVRTDRVTILFDVGDNPQSASPSPLEQNMASLGVSLKEVDLVFISHRHPDHVGGFKWWRGRTFSLTGASQPALGDLPVYVSDYLTYPGSRLILARRPTPLAEGVVTTGAFTFFEPYPAWQILPNYNEQALAVNVTGQGIVLIIGCGHMGLKALLDRAGRLFDAPIAGVVGGLHYTKASAEALQPDITLLKRVNPGLIALSPHDSGTAALAAFARAFPAAYRPLRVGEAIRISSLAAPPSPLVQKGA